MSDYTEALLEDDFHVNEVCMYILSRMLNIGIGVVTRTDIWSTTQSDTLSNCKMFFAYCGEGIFIPIIRIQPGEERKLEEKYLGKSGEDKSGKGAKGCKKQQDRVTRSTDPNSKNTCVFN